MRFIDEVDIYISSGKGGDGNTSFRREKYIPRGGPDGGNGGRGGDVIFECDENINTLLHFRGKRRYQASDGQAGQNKQRDGKDALPIILKVPVGTIVKNIETQDIVADLSFHGQTIAVAKGGRGGLGNMYFKSSTNQAPLYSQDGEEGVELELKLELKLLADMALVGLPNAGKSTLLSTISNAKPKVADYPFTTLKPELGVINHREKTFVMADIPGLIEDASKGKGLGLSFLKHIERTKVLVHLIDCSMFLDEFEALDSYSTIRNELEEFGRKLEDKREIVCLTKTDAMTEDEISRFQAFLADSLCKKVLPISTVSGKNMEFFKDILVTALEDLPQ